MKISLDIRQKDLDIILTILQKNIPSKTTVWVFGSRAKNTARKFSDLDLAIDTNQQPMPLALMTNLLDAFEESDLPYKVDIVDLNTIDSDFRSLITNEKQFLFSK